MRNFITSLGIVLITTFSVAPAFSQSNNNDDEWNRLYAGVGFGMDYGGIIGIKAEYNPLPYVGGFIGLGYNLVGLGVNGGIVGRAFPYKRVTPVAIAMVGYNAVIKVDGASQYDKIYYGVSVGLGADFIVGPRRRNKMFAAVYYPFRNAEFEKDNTAIKNNPNIIIEQEVLPITFTFGFMFGLF